MMFKHLQRGRLSKARSQNGAALILIMFILGLAIAAYTIKAFTAASMQARQDEESMKTLGEAKAALIAWAVSNPHPGQMPFPDRATDGDYDGFSDCFSKSPSVSFNYKFLLGQLPIYGQTSPCVKPWSGLGGDWRDGQNNRLWYAVSRNLVHDYEVSPSDDPTAEPIINPGMINGPFNSAPYLRKEGTTAYPWFQVYDANGVLLSDRVAAVIIAPGNPLNNQNRSAKADPDQFLDQVVMFNGVTYKNYGLPINDLDVQKFIIGQDEKTVSHTDPRYQDQDQHPYHFNDKLVYITIDELMAALEKRVASEVKAQLEKYYVASAASPADRFYPYAAPLGVSKGYSCKTANYSGLLPIDPAANCSFDYQKQDEKFSATASCSFDYVSNIVFTRMKGNSYQKATDNCSASGRRCTCMGAGTCEGNAPKFSCDSAGVCVSETDKDNEDSRFTFKGGRFEIAAGDCSLSPAGAPPACLAGFESTVDCIGAGDNNASGSSAYSACTDPDFNSVTTNSLLPAWFKSNGWQDYVYYAIARNGSPTMKVGTKTDVTALLATTGSAIVDEPYVESKAAAQSRASCNLNDYLDSDKDDATNGIYDATNRLRTPNYNDQLFIVAP